MAVKDNGIAKMEESAHSVVQSPQGRPNRILVVEDEPLWRVLNTEMLIDAGYHVDTAEDGAAAWETLQFNTYDLVVTDNNMPKVSGLELIEKLRGAGMGLPVIMATGASPVFAPYSRFQPAATLLKPYTAADLLGTVRNVLRPAVPIGMLQLFLIAANDGQELMPPPSGAGRLSSDGAGMTGMTLSVGSQQFDGKDGKTLPMSTTSWIKDLIESDELQAISEGQSPRQILLTL